MEAVPDPDRLGGIGWLERTHGHLTPEQRRALLGATLRTYSAHAQGLVGLLIGRRARGPVDLPDPPDSSLARAAEAAAVTAQSPSMAAHGWRTWLYGSLLAGLDGQHVDPELFYVAALLHDTGVTPSVPGEDFTLRSAAQARAVMEAEGAADADVRAVQDAIAVHVTPGIEPERDGTLGCYVQAGAMLDVVGLRAVEVPADTVRAVNERHPRAQLVAELVQGAREEAAAIPDGRFALVNRVGFTMAVRTARGVG